MTSFMVSRLAGEEALDSGDGPPTDMADGRPLRVLMSAYACEPGTGSEQGVGWNVARAVARHAEVWVITRANNRPLIEAELGREPVPGLHFVYFDLPRWARRWKRHRRGVHLYYYLWQLGIARVALALHRDLQFDIVHHVTFVKYWAPSLACRVPVPFIWGPVGGGESTPEGLWRDLKGRDRWLERLRHVARAVGERDPLVRLTARRSVVALATTNDTARRLRGIGARDVRVMSQVGMSEAVVPPHRARVPTDAVRLRVVSVGRLVHWKGFHLGLEGFAAAGLPGSEYWILGSGPDRERLVDDARRLGISDRVAFMGQLPHQEVMLRLSQCDVLVHPSMHDSGAFVCVEAMALGLPVVCLDSGGPAVLVDEDSGVKARCTTAADAISDMASALRKLGEDADTREAMGAHARRRAEHTFSWEAKALSLMDVYQDVVARCRA